MVITLPTTFDLTFQLQLTDANNVLTTTLPQTLKIAFDPNGKTWKTYTDYAVFVSTDKHYKVGLLLNSLTVNGVAANNSPLKTSLFVQLEHEVERFYTISSSTTPVKPVVAYVAATRELVVTIASTTQPEAVDVEWTYIDDYSGNPSNPSLNLTSTPYNFKNNATRVSLTDDFIFISPLNSTAIPLTTYRIPFVFEQGYVIFRTRALGYAGTGFDEPVYSPWSLSDIGVQITNISAFHYQQVTPPNVHEKNKNWQFSAMFSEGGKSKNVVNYADGSSRLRQAVTKLSTDNFAIVGETIYDHQGRAAVQTLPAPTDKQYLAYFTKFSRAVTTNIKYNAQHFDLDPASNCATMPAAMSNTEGAERYYSPSNPFNINAFRNLTPNTEGYPFVQTEFTPDLTGRIRRQSNVGKNHALGSTHETQYLYGKPFQEEIDRLFGTDIGWASHYKKNVVLDANGQASVSYVDLDGKAVATALIGGNPRNLMPLDDLANSNETITVDLLNKSLPNAPQGADNVKDLFAGTLTVNRELTVVGNSLPYTFQYQVTPERYQDNCLTTNCLDCVYDLNISLKDKCGNLKMPFVQQQIGTPTQAIISPPNPPLVCKNQPFTLPNLTATLSTGNYTLNKTLTVNQATLDYYTQIYLDSAKKYNVCLPSMKDLITASLQKIDTNGCHIDCQSCLTAIGTEAAYIARFAAQIGASEFKSFSIPNLCPSKWLFDYRNSSFVEN